MSQATLRIQKMSGHAGSVPGEDAQREFTACKLIDTTTCIGCKACEVACMEWNDLPFGETVFDNSYQTMPETRRDACTSAPRKTCWTSRGSARSSCRSIQTFRKPACMTRKESAAPG